MSHSLEAAAYMAYFAYIDSSLPAPVVKDFKDMLATTGSVPNGPWTLAWGPAFNDGILTFVASGVDGSLCLAFRGTNTDFYVPGFFEDLVTDLDVLYPVPWLYPQTVGAKISPGTNQALAMAAASTDPSSGIGLLDFLRSQTTSAGIDIMVTGHSLGGALAVAATAWLNDQMQRRDCDNFTIYPYSFAAPTVTDSNFATFFEPCFKDYCALINVYDIVPMAWTNLADILPLYPGSCPSLWDYSEVMYGAIDLLSTYDLGYSAVKGGQVVSFTGALICNYQTSPASGCQSDVYVNQPSCNIAWPQEAAAMHSMQCVYFLKAVGTIGPALPGVTPGAVRPPSSLVRARRRLLA